MTSAATEVTESLPLARGARFAFGLQRLMSKVGVLPSAADVPVKISMAKRQTMTSAGWMVPKFAEIQIETAATDTGIPLRIYRPAAGTAKSTTVLYAHGGGFAVGGAQSVEWFSRELAQAGFPVVSVEYRLAPECPFPGPLDDVRSGLSWLDANRDRFGTERIVAAGDSAGGNLTAALCLLIARDGGPQIDQQVLIYPALDLTASVLPTDVRYAGLSKSDLDAAAGFYSGDADRRNPLISPVYAPDLTGLPPAVILTGEHDILREDGRRYADRLREAGVPIFFRQYPGLPHGFFSLPKLCGPQAFRALDDLIRCLEG